jgi:hypothetical protein
MVAMVKPGKESPQYVYSQRDIEYLEKQGWVRMEPKQPRPVLKLRKDKKHDHNIR